MQKIVYVVSMSFCDGTGATVRSHTQRHPISRGEGGVVSYTCDYAAPHQRPALGIVMRQVNRDGGDVVGGGVRGQET